MTFKLSQRSLNSLKGVHPDLVKVVKRAIEITPVDFVVIEGLRTLERQKELLKSKATTTLNSRHLTGHAVDIVPYIDGQIRWDWPPYQQLQKAIKQAAKEVGVTIEWGGDWKSFKDGPHWQLPWSKYPAGKTTTASVASLPVHSPETDTAAHTKAIASVATGATAVQQIALEPVMDGIKVLTDQQDSLASGDIVRIVIGAVIVIGTVWYAWKKLR